MRASRNSRSCATSSPNCGANASASIRSRIAGSCMVSRRWKPSRRPQSARTWAETLVKSDSLIENSYIITRYTLTIHVYEPPVPARAGRPRDAHRNADASVRDAAATEGPWIRRSRQRAATHEPLPDDRPAAARRADRRARHRARRRVS
ncbi:hypothetical protein F01_10004 [Burkholderia cenocepacia]|nr:hypothetical protein F01_10004 [Burkholderia cenocepacia]